MKIIDITVHYNKIPFDVYFYLYEEKMVHFKKITIEYGDIDLTDVLNQKAIHEIKKLGLNRLKSLHRCDFELSEVIQ